jgi:hypothetical protein
MDYLKRKVAYVREHYGVEDEMRLMLATYQNLPVVKEARVDEVDPNRVHLELWNGEKQGVSLRSLRRKGISGKAETTKSLNTKMRYYGSALEEDCILLLHEGGRLMASQHNIDKYLAAFAKTMPKQIPVKDKLAELKAAGAASHEDTMEEFIRSYSASPQFYDRVEKRKAKAEKPGPQESEE